MCEGAEAPTLISMLNLPPLPGLSHADSIFVEYTWVSMVLVVIMLSIVAFNMKRVPRGLQNVVELIIGFLENFITSVIGHKGLAYFPLIGTVFFFIMVSNYLGLVPGCIAPTGSINTTAAWAILVFLFYNVLGFQKHGFGYLKHFLGPIWWLTPLMLPVEIISQFARPLSLAVRLYANILAGEKIIALLFAACAIGAPVVWMMWESALTCWFQAFVFSIMTMVYISGAVASDEEH